MEEFKKEIKQFQQCEWVREEFHSAQFGDKRLFLRLLVVAEHLAKHPEAPINQANEIWKKTKAAYRFFDNEKVLPEFILGPHLRRTIERVSQQTEEVLIIQDTTFLNYSNMKSSGDLGPIGKLHSSCMGLVMHTSLATTEYGLPLGLLQQKIWARDPKEHGKAMRRSKKLIEDKESFRWIEALQNYTPRLPKKCKVVTVCDREADIYDFFSEAEKLGARYLVRAKYNRCIPECPKLWEFMEGKEAAATEEILVPRQPGRPERTATVEIRYAPVTFACPVDRPRANKLPTVSLYAVYVNELDPPPDIDEPLSWMLLTNVSTNSLSEAQGRIQWYKQRWQIEILHRILKSGCKVEHARLEKNHRRIPYLTLSSIISWKLLLLTYFNRISPEASATALLSQSECNVLYSITHNSPIRQHEFNAKKATKWIAQLGGYMARRSDPLPGPTHIWRGWQRLQDFTLMYSLTKLQI
jgi:hypothetical protein